MKNREFLLKKSTRIIAFVSSCVIFAVCVGCCMGKLISVGRYLEDFQEERPNIYEFSEEQQELFSELWVVGAMYLRNLDGKGNFTGSKKLEESTKNTLRELGLMDENDKITINPTENFRYYVSWNDNSISSDEDIYNDIDEADNYSITYNNSNINISNNRYFDYYGFKWYETDYGMTYYDFPHKIGGKGAAATYDYDTSELDYTYDNMNVKIFNKSDNTPSGFLYDKTHTNYTQRYYYNGYYYDDETAIPTIPEEIIDDINIEDSYIYYDTSERSWTAVKKPVAVEGNDLRLKIGVMPSDSILAPIREVRAENQSQEVNFINYVLKFIPFVIFSLLLMLFFFVTSGYNPAKNKSLTQEKTFVLSPVDKIWAEFVIAITVMAAAAGGMLLMETDDALYLTEQVFADNSAFPAAIWTAGLTAAFAILSLAVNSLIKRFKCRSFYKTTFVRHIVNVLIKILRIAKKKIQSVIKSLAELRLSKEMADTEVIAKRFFIRLVLFALGMLFVTALENGLLLIALIAVYGYFSLKDIVGLIKLSRQIDAVYNGDYSPVEIDRNSPIYSLSEKINNISDGIQTAVDKKIQSEKMKIDLVTNVSHDLKTPLTSIISYINLLSMENDLSPVARDYVKILEQKSARLSEIVADVFDIAKATSRTDINFEMIDATILLEQVLADMADKIQAAGRDIRKSVFADSTPILADGARLYRVLQNLIDNALKYSLENTRIYIILEVYSGDVAITVKNISSYEIKYTPEELTERFTRGDESRTTEGSGLGLSIAKSFTEACNGKFEIDIDGDVFTAKIQLPITKKSKD